MRIDLHDPEGNPRLTVYVDPTSPASVVKASDGRGPAVSLDWDKALDDKRQLRHCPVCGCPDLFIRAQTPRVTLFALVVAAAVVAMVFYGYGLSTPAVLVLFTVLVLDLLIWLFATRFLVCYRCASEFRDTPIPPRTRPWDNAVAQRYREAEAARPAPTGDAADDANDETDNPDTSEPVGRN